MVHELDPRDKEEVQGHLDLLEALERAHSRKQIEALQVESEARELAEKVLGVRARLDEALLRMKPRYQDEGEHVVFCVDRRRWILSPSE